MRTAALVVSLLCLLPTMAGAQVQAACHSIYDLPKLYDPSHDWGADLYDETDARAILDGVLVPNAGPPPAYPFRLVIGFDDTTQAVDFFLYDDKGCLYVHAGPFTPQSILRGWPDGVPVPFKPVGKPGTRV